MVDHEQQAHSTHLHQAEVPQLRHLPLVHLASKSVDQALIFIFVHLVQYCALVWHTILDGGEGGGGTSSPSWFWCLTLVLLPISSCHLISPRKFNP